ncbi:Uncharacterised protein g3989 [Pycnogonum litorale]
MLRHYLFYLCIFILTCCCIHCLFFQDSRIRTDIVIITRIRPPLRSTERSNSDPEIDTLKEIVDKGFLEFLIKTAGRVFMEYRNQNGSDGDKSIIRRYVNRLKMTASRTETINEIFDFFGLKDELCRSKFVCELYQMLSSTNDYKYKFLLWFINRHVSGLSSIIKEDLDPGCHSRGNQIFELDCHRKYQVRCPMSLKQLIN